MQPAAFVAISPLIVLAAGAVLMLVVTALWRHHGLTVLLALTTLALATCALWLAAAVAPARATMLLSVDRFALFYMGLILAACFVVVLLSWSYVAGRGEPREEYYILLVVATLGACVLAASHHFASLFLGLEMLSVALYGLIAYFRDGRAGVEAGIKYLVLAGASTAILLFGMALVYAQTGTMQFDLMQRVFALGGLTDATTVAGIGLLFAGVAFKLALVPFHMWTADVYAGAPAPVTAYIATVSKGAVFAVLLRYVLTTGMLQERALVISVTVIAMTSMLAGNLLALLANSVKRILAYSSIAHLGYLLVALLAARPLGATAVAFYFVAYFATTLSAFGVVAALSTPELEADDVAVYRGLFWRRPWLATILTTALLSLAGIPLTAGFIGKLYLVIAGVDAALWLLVITLVVASLVGVFYYLRLVVIMFAAAPAPAASNRVPLAVAAGLAVNAVFLVVVWLGVYPSAVQQLVAGAMAGSP